MNYIKINGILFDADVAALARVLSPEITRQQRRNQRALGV